jgi:hypothetical protein
MTFLLPGTRRAGAALRDVDRQKIKRIPQPVVDLTMRTIGGPHTAASRIGSTTSMH